MRAFRTLRGVALFALFAFCLLPILWQILTSLKDDASIVSLPPILPSPATLVNYEEVLRETPILRVILNTLFVAGATTVLSIAVGASAAFALTSLRVRGGTWILAGVLAISMFPPIATISPIYLMARFIGLRDSLLGLVLLDTTFSLPLGIWVMANFFRNIPREMLLAALVDGCSVPRAFVSVMLPLSAPGLAASAILVFIFAWNEFLVALTLTVTVSSRTVPVAIALFPGLHEVPWGEMAAASVLVTAPIALLVFVFERRIVEGLTAGSVKG